MARAQPFNYYGYRFHALFYLADDKPIPVTRRNQGEDYQIGFSSIHHSAAGLELWTPHLVDEPLLIAKLEGAFTAEVMLLPREEDVPARVITYMLDQGSAKWLGVSINPKPMVVDLDAACSGVALDGVLFEHARVLKVDHRVVELTY